jgi:hypothetical protein
MMNAPLFAAFVALCAVVGATLGSDKAHVMAVLLYILAAVVSLQAGYFVALLLSRV